MGLLRVAWRTCRTAALPAGAALALATWAPGAAAATSSSSNGVWHGVGEGVDVDLGHSSSGAPPNKLDSISSSNYQVELSFTFSVNHAGKVSGTGSGSYTDAHWQLSGRNGQHGSFRCEPPISAPPFSVEVGGHTSGGQMHLSLSMPTATETNADYNCGAEYSGYATTTHLMTRSLSLVGGDDLSFSLSAPSSLTRQQQTTSGGVDTSEDDQHTWAFSFTPPAFAAGGSGASGRAKAETAPAAGASGCQLTLTSVSARPSRSPSGNPIAVSFYLSQAAQARLLVGRANGPITSVAELEMPAGRNELIWGGWIGTAPARPGTFRLTVAAHTCSLSRTQTVTVTVG
jgi:hypothetical protein